MAQWLVLRDPDPDRRRRAVAAAIQCLEGDHGLTVSRAECGPAAVVWGVAGDPPVDRWETPGASCILIGDAIPGPGPERVAAAVWADAVRRLEPASVFDGLHIGIVMEPSGGVVVGGDLLGLLPVYHATAGEAVLAASAPGLFRTHPGFVDALDPQGLTGLLLTNGLIDGLTILRGVRRLTPGHLLRMPPDGAPVEQPQYRFPVSTEHYDQPLEEWAHRVHEALASACRRHVVPDVPHALLLSGGLDSRLLAGLLARQGVAVTAVTRGLRTDNDYRCARRVAHRLGFPHRLASQADGTWDEFRQLVRWRGITSSPGLGGDTLGDALRGLHPRAVSGYLMDAVVGGSHIYWCYSHAEHTCTYDRFFHKLNLHGLPVATLRRLLRPEVFGDSLEAMLERVRHRFTGLGDTVLERAWRFDLEHRQRYQIGTMLARQVEAVWPCAPHIDREVLATVGGIPLGMIGGRHVEREVVIRFYRDLARLPLDRGSHDTTPLDPDVRGILRSLPGRAFRMAAGKLRLPLRERRYYHRTLGMDGPGWRAIREGLEPLRAAAHEIFDAATFDALVPRPDRPWEEGFQLVDAVGRKLLLAAATWWGSAR